MNAVNWLGVLVLAAALALVVWGAGRARVLFLVRSERGELRLVRGRLPTELMDEIADVLQRNRASDVEVVARREGGTARITVRGRANDALEQQLRNVLGRFPLRRIESGRLRAR